MLPLGITYSLQMSILEMQITIDTIVNQTN